MKSKNTIVDIRCTTDWLVKARLMAEKKKMSLSEFIILAVNEYINKRYKYSLSEISIGVHN